jgi:3-dehydroquinate synthase
VINDGAFLGTLSERDWVAGAAEAFKVAIIKDRGFLESLAENADKIAARDTGAMAQLVTRCATLHLDHIREGGDPFEAGSARPLDFGHWAAHRLEDMTGYELRHGEAVAIGIAIDMHCAVELGLVEAAECELVCAAMERCGLALWHDAMDRRTDDGALEIFAGLEQFREHLGGVLTLAMPAGLGDRTDINELPEEMVEHAAAALKERAKQCAGKARTSHTA